MKVFCGEAEVPHAIGPTAVTIGKFDGVHAGHRGVISRLRLLATERGLTSVVVTFDRNPLEVLAPDRCPPSLVSRNQKSELLAEAGIDGTLVLEFDEGLASLDPETFVSRILVDTLNVAVVLTGHDFRFGDHGSGDVELLTKLGAKYGFEVILIDDVGVRGGDRVSSTHIRSLLSEGLVADAARVLTRFPRVRGEVVHGAARGRELGFPTANLSENFEGLAPADGVYAGWLIDGGCTFAAAISVGDNPTFDTHDVKQVEAYVLDQNLDLYGHIVEIVFVERLRDMIAFTGVEPLIAQIHDDVERTRLVLKGHPDPERVDLS